MEERPATQKELLQAQLDSQAQLFEQIGKVEQAFNEGMEEMRKDFSEVKERLSHLEGEADADQRQDSNAVSRRHLNLYALGIILNFLFWAVTTAVTVLR